jgi:hypothetical protein
VSTSVLKRWRFSDAWVELVPFSSPILAPGLFAGFGLKWGASVMGDRNATGAGAVRHGAARARPERAD